MKQVQTMGADESPRRMCWFRRYRRQHYAREWLLLLFFLNIFWNECVLRATTGKSFFDPVLILIALYSFVAALLLYSLCCFLPRRVGAVVQTVLYYLVFIFFASQIIYHHIFHFFYSAYSMSNGGQVMEFWRTTVRAMKAEALPLLLTLLPAVLLTLFAKPFNTHRLKRWYQRLIFPIGMVALHFVILLTLPVFGKGPVSAYELYHTTNDLPAATQQMGLLAAFRLDMHRLIFGFHGGQLVDPTINDAEIESEIANLTEPSTDTTEPETTEPPYDTSPNILQIDFDELMQGEENERIRQLDEYFSKQTPTNKNDHTGMFKGCNLILITAESFSYMAIDPELTPTLYKMQQEGMNFTNFYTPYWGVSTSDGEYVALTGTIPKSGTWSFSDSSDNAMPLTMAQQLKHLGYSAYAYHDHTYTYYHRNRSHPNLGYIFKARDHGLTLTWQWPESDVEMIDQTTDDYMHSEPFHAYYMTVSGHLEYNTAENSVARKAYDEVADLPYSEPVKCYIACQRELDKAMKLLLERLDEAGVAENTVIVLSPDHYPYGLTVEQQSELLGHKIDERFELYRNTMLIYKKGMQPETIDKLACSMDILPTLSNLFGLDFDSRLYMGHDIFSDATPLVVFSDRSWLTEFVSYYAPTGQVTMLGDYDVSSQLIAHYNEIVSNKFLVSEWILEEDYWRTLFGDNLPPDDRESTDALLPSVEGEETIPKEATVAATSAPAGSPPNGDD